MDGWITIRTGGSLTLSITLSLRSLEFSQHRVEKMLREGKSKPLSGEPPSLVYSHGRASLSHSAVCLCKVWPCTCIIPAIMHFSKCTCRSHAWM